MAPPKVAGDLRNLGRSGGIVLFVFSAGLLAVALGTFDCNVHGQGRYASASAPLLICAAVGLLASIVVLRSVPAKIRESMPKDELRSLLASRPVPFSICTRCHALLDGLAPACSSCGSVADCLVVADEPSRSIARAALG